MMQSLHLSLVFTGLFFAAQLLSQSSTPNNTLRGRILYQSSGDKPAVGVRIAEPDATAVFSLNNGDYELRFQNKRNGEALALEVGRDNAQGQKIELVNEKEVKAAKLPAAADNILEIIVCTAGQRDIAAQKYYRILRTTADRELERKKKEVEDLLAQTEKDYQKISDLFAQLDKMQAALDSANIREQAFNIASINLDRASQMVKDAVRKIDEENDVEGALKILSAEALDTAYERASALKKQADAAIRQVIEGYEFKISLLQPQFKYGEAAECYEKIAGIYEKEDYDKVELADYFFIAAFSWGENGNFQKQLEFNLKALAICEKNLPHEYLILATSYNNLALTYLNLAEYQKALEFNLKTLAILEKILPADHPVLATSYNNLAETYGKLGEYQKQLESNLKALAIREKSLPADHLDLANSYNNLAGAYGNLGDYQKQLEYNLKALTISEKVLPPSHPYMAISYANTGRAYRDVGDHTKGIEYGQKAIQIGDASDPKHPRLNQFYVNLGISYIKAHQYPEAKTALEKSESLKAEASLYKGWAMYYALQKKKKQSIESLQKAVELGFKDLKWLETEPDLRNIRKEKGYKDLVGQLKKQ